MVKQLMTPRSSVHSQVEAGVFVDDVLVANVTPPQTSVPLDLYETGSEHVLSVLSRDGRRLRNTDAAVNRALTGSIVGRDQARPRTTTPCTKQGFRACTRLRVHCLGAAGAEIPFTAGRAGAPF